MRHTTSRAGVSAREGRPAGAGALRFADTRPWVMNVQCDIGIASSLPRSRCSVQSNLGHRLIAAMIGVVLKFVFVGFDGALDWLEAPVFWLGHEIDHHDIHHVIFKFIK